MKVIIDTCSLLSLVRYYLPFDKQSFLLNFIKQKIESGGILLIDRVIEECKYLSKGIIIDTLSFLKDKSYLETYKIPIDTEYITPPKPKVFSNQVDNQFVLGSQKNKLDETSYESLREHFLKSADMGLIIYGLNLKRENSLFNEDIVIVTEESEESNDNKLFKKIPGICEILDIKTMSLPKLLYDYDINILFK